MKNKLAIYALSATVLGIITFGTAYKFFEKPVQEEAGEGLEHKSANVVEIYNTVTEEAEPTESADIEPAHYRVMLREGRLNLYFIDGDGEKEVKSVEVNTQMFPSQDRELLKSGIKALSLEEGVEIMENFIS